MKKTGFTLAEVLITLAIIGIVSALAMPALVGSYQKSKVAPSVRKFINTMEITNQHILGELESSTLTSAVSDVDDYLDVLGEYVEGSTDGKTISSLTLAPKSYSGSSDGLPQGFEQQKIFNMASGEAFSVELVTNSSTIAAAKARAKGSYKGEVGHIVYDLNGFETKPNRLGRDIFCFVLDNGGKLLPEGGLSLSRAYTSAQSEDEEDGGEEAASTAEQEWKDGSDKCNADEVTSGVTCAGSIMDNNWKVIYKY